MLCDFYCKLRILVRLDLKFDLEDEGHSHEHDSTDEEVDDDENVTIPDNESDNHIQFE